MLLGALATTAGWSVIAMLFHGGPESLEDYAGPVATFLAASAAAWVA
jgi:hypothetical protein